MKICKRCKASLPNSRFYRAGKYYHSNCKKCYKIISMEPATSAGRLEALRERLEEYWCAKSSE